MNAPALRAASRLVIGHLRFRRTETVLTLAAMTCTTSTLALALILHTALTGRFPQLDYPPPRIDPYLVGQEDTILNAGSATLGLLALASVALVLKVGAADRSRRAILLRDLGATPSFILMAQLAEHLLLAVTATIAGLAIGALAAPLLTEPRSLTQVGPATLTANTAAVVLGAAIAIAVVAAAPGAVRASLRVAPPGAARGISNPNMKSPRRGLLIPRLALQVTTSSPLRGVLAAASVAIAVAVLVAALMAQNSLVEQYGTLTDERAARLEATLATITVLALALGLLDAIVITMATAAEAASALAVIRALGGTPRQLVGLLVCAQLLPAALGVAGGLPLGVWLYTTGATVPDSPSLVLLGSTAVTALIILAVLAALPATAALRRPATAALQAERNS